MDFNIYKDIMNNHYFRDGTYHGAKDPPTNSTSGNHHIINAIHYSICDRYNEVTGEDQIIASNYIDKCLDITGVFNRAPDKFDHQAHDDIIGISCTSKKLFLPYANYINRYGEKHFWYFDNTEETSKFEIKNWHGRFPWAIATYKHCAGYRLNLFYQLALGLYFYTGTRNDDTTDTSGRILRWLQKESVKGKYKIVDFFIKKWEDKLKEQYSNAMGDVMSIYYGVNHPFAQILQGVV